MVILYYEGEISLKKKLMFVSTIALTALLSASLGAYAATKYTLSFNGNKTALDVQVIKGEPYVSAKKFGELVGQKVTVDSKKGTISVVTPKSTTTTTLKDGEYQAKDFILSDVQAKEDTFGWDVSAEVRSSKSFKGASLTITFYDSKGKRIGTASGALNNYTKGETVTVQFLTTDDLTGWAKLKPQVDFAL